VAYRSRPRTVSAALLLIAAILAGCRIEHTGNPTGREISNTALAVEVTHVLAASATGWNRGDLGTFMDAYLDSPTTTYWGSQGLLRGYAEIRHHYAPRFAPGAERDSLRFDDIEARRLGTDYALATSRWVLFRGDSVTATGPFTLVLRRVAGKWRIIHDHSSTFPRPTAGDTTTSRPPASS
jgi:beta-aspartyl-peptidase (threonine type)